MYPNLVFKSCIQILYSNLVFTSCIKILYSNLVFKSCIQILYSSVHGVHRESSVSLAIQYVLPHTENQHSSKSDSESIQQIILHLAVCTSHGCFSCGLPQCKYEYCFLHLRGKTKNNKQLVEACIALKHSRGSKLGHRLTYQIVGDLM